MYESPVGSNTAPPTPKQTNLLLTLAIIHRLFLQLSLTNHGSFKALLLLGASRGGIRTLQALEVWVCMCVCVCGCRCVCVRTSGDAHYC